MMSHSQDKGSYFWSASQILASYSGKKPPRADRGGSAHPTKYQCRATQHPGESTRAALGKRPDQIDASAILVSLVVGQWETDAPTPFRPGLVYCLATLPTLAADWVRRDDKPLGIEWRPRRGPRTVFSLPWAWAMPRSAPGAMMEEEQHPKVPGHSCRGTRTRTRWKRRTWENTQQGQGAIPSLA